MKIGVVSDLHNNLLALNCILHHFQDSGCEKVICCGDIVGIGPFPEETVRRLMKVDHLICVRGNHEDYLRNISNRESLIGIMSENETLYHQWEYTQLSNECKDFLDSLPVSCSVIIDGIKLFVTHYARTGTSYRSVERDLTIHTCEQMFDGHADIVLFGHSHKFFDLENSNTRFINVPSLGCPAKSRNITHAGILEIVEKNCTYHQVALEYDVASVIAQIDCLNYPSSDEIKKIFYGL